MPTPVMARRSKPAAPGFGLPAGQLEKHGSGSPPGPQLVVQSGSGLQLVVHPGSTTRVTFGPTVAAVGQRGQMKESGYPFAFVFREGEQSTNFKGPPSPGRALPAKRFVIGGRIQEGVQALNGHHFIGHGETL